MSKVLVTSALPYINGMKHLGNLIGSLLPADVYSRFSRHRGDKVLFICATDEHGTPAELAAREAQQTVEEFCAIQHDRHKAIYERFGIQFDYFGRSSSPQNAKLTQHFYRKLDENGHIDERVVTQLFSIDDGRFLPDRYVIGTCPRCGYTIARGDQCENCASLLDPTDLIEPRSVVSGSSRLEMRQSRHLFLRLDRLADRVEQWLNSQDRWPPLVVSITRKWLREGLTSRAITRDLSWGVPVPRRGFEDKVFYVWFDAPIEYIGATKEWADQQAGSRDFREWWLEANDVRYVQFMAKDNIPFHTITFPATLIGTGEPWKRVDYIKGFHWLNFYGKKFSTSQNQGIFADQALEDFPADYWRYWLLAHAPETDDSTFTFELFRATVNADLVDRFGNFVSRCLKLCRARFGESVPTGGQQTESEVALSQILDTHVQEYNKHLSSLQFRRSVETLRMMWDAANSYVTNMAPWSEVTANRSRGACILRTAINMVRIFAKLADPLLPYTASTLRQVLNLTDCQDKWPESITPGDLETLQGGHPFTVPENLFHRITEAQVEILAHKYGAPRKNA